MHSLLCSIMITRGAQFRVRGENDILAGMSAALTGPSSAVGLMYRDALQACIERVNHEGGAGGRSIRLLALDDGGRPERAEENLYCLIEHDGVAALFGPAERAMASVSSRLAHAAGIACFDVFDGASEPCLAGHEPAFLAVPCRSIEELHFLLGRLQGAGYARVAMLRYADPAGAALEYALRTKAVERKLTVADVATIPCGLGEPGEVRQAAQRLARQAPDAAVLLAVSEHDAAQMIWHRAAANREASRSGRGKTVWQNGLVQGAESAVQALVAACLRADEATRAALAG